MVKAQLKELDAARKHIQTDLADKIHPRDLVHVVDALIKVQKAERELYDETFVGNELGDEFEVSELID